MAHFIDGAHSEFALRLRERRKLKGITLEELARSAGVSQRTISLYEKGKFLPRAAPLDAIAKKLDVSPQYLKDGQTEEWSEFLASQRAEGAHVEAIKRPSLIYVEDWANLLLKKPWMLPNYSPDPTRSQPPNIEDFIPVVKSHFDHYRATRYPGSCPDNLSYPAGSILIFDADINTFDRVNNGDDLLFAIHNSQEVGLRRYSREPGVEQGYLVSVNPAMPPDPIPAEIDIDILGVVVSQVITRQV